jgi:polar amino acid transport system substrate-binding protein
MSLAALFPGAKCATRSLAAALLGLVLGGCAGTPTTPVADARQALAPAGKLRIAFLVAPLYATRDPASGELKGVAVDLGKELATRLGVPFEPAGHPNLPAVIRGAQSGEWDVALMGINAERAAVVDFSAPYMDVEQGYLVRAGVPIAAASDVDKAGTRVGVIEKSGADLHLSGTLKNATLVRSSLNEILSQLAAGKLEVVAATKAALFSASAKQPGSRVLDGRLLVEPIGMGVPKGRDAAAARYVAQFVEEAKAQGTVKAAIERAGLRGVTVAPPR